MPGARAITVRIRVFFPSTVSNTGVDSLIVRCGVASSKVMFGVPADTRIDTVDLAVITGIPESEHSTSKTCSLSSSGTEFMMMMLPVASTVKKGGADNSLSVTGRVGVNSVSVQVICTPVAPIPSDDRMVPVYRSSLNTGGRSFSFCNMMVNVAVELLGMLELSLTVTVRL